MEDEFQEVSLGSLRRRGGRVADDTNQHSEDISVDNIDESKEGLNVWRLAALTFFTVSGGPYGLEPIVATVGPYYSIVGLLVIPWVWGLPTALMTAELASAIPEMGGYIVWVERSMGDFWAFQNAMWNMFTNVLDNSLYPVLFVDYLEEMSGHDFSYFARTSIGGVLVFTLGLVNVVGVDIVGDGASGFGVFVILPFIFMVLIGVFSEQFEQDVWIKSFDEPKWGVYVAMLLWNTCGYDSAGTCASEVENPGEVYPKAMLVTIVVTTLLYVLPLMVGVCFAEDYALWDDGYFVIVGEMVGGTWLKFFILVAGAVSSLGQLNSTICTSSRALACSAGFGYAPKRFARIHSKYGTPVAAIMLNCTTIFLLVATGLDFESLAEMSMWLYGLTLLFEYGALIILRVNQPELERPYEIPLGVVGICLMSVPPAACCFVLMYLSSELTWIVNLILLGVALLATVPYAYYSDRQVVLPKPLRRLTQWFSGKNSFRQPQPDGVEMCDHPVTTNEEPVRLFPLDGAF